MVGETSARIPPSRSVRSGAVTITGTGLRECAVFGRTVVVEHVVAVAVVGGDQAHPARRLHRLDDLRQAGVDGLDPLTAAGITPVWPTMSGLAKLMIAKP